MKGLNAAGCPGRAEMQERVPLFMLLIANAAIYDAAARGFFRGDLLLEGGRIAEVSRGISARREKLPDGAVLDVGGRTVLPGLVDIHTHGRAGGDFGSADGAMLERMLASYLASGVTTVLPTLASAEPTRPCSRESRASYQARLGSL